MPQLKSQPLLRDRVRVQLVDLLKSESIQLGDKLPSETQLARHMNCNRQTLRQALDVLESDGLITRKKGSGTFLRIRPDAARAAVVGIMMCDQGHVYHDLTRLLAERLQADSWIPTILAVNPTQRPNAAFDLSPLHRLMDMGCRHLVLQDWALEVPDLVRFLRASEETLEQVIWLTEGTILPCDLPGDVNSLHHAAGFQLALQHLQALGHRRVALGAVHPAHLGSFDHYALHWHEAIMRTGPWESVEVIGIRHDQQPALEALLSRPDRPTAIVTSDDWRAVTVMRTAAALGLQVPRDLSVIGALNTPWAEEFNLTSTSSELQARVTAICDLVRQSRLPGCRRQTLVRPHLVLRGSTSAPPAA